MAKFAIFFSYTPETWAKMIKNPTDRAAAVRSMVEPMGGKLESLYFMFGGHDGMAIVDMPDSESAAAAAILVASTGALKSLETRELIEPADLPGVLAKAEAGLASYRPPGV